LKEETVFGIRRDGSFYTRIQWASDTVQSPLYWVCNLIDDDIDRNGGTWGANSLGPVNVILDFFGEEQEIGKIRIFHNVGATGSVLEELAKTINFYISDDDVCKRFGDENADINQVNWEKILTCEMKKSEGWFEFEISKIIRSKYIRMELEENFGTPLSIPWTETSELKIYPRENNVIDERTNTLSNDEERDEK
jgi:hypothetical protein